MIALAIVALLLVGISRIFALTSATIGSGQATAKTLRSHKAIQTALSTDVMGGGDLANPDYQSGMLPLVNTLDPDYASPFLSISNFRVAAYKNKEDETADVNQPAAFTVLNPANYTARSAAIRDRDLNNDGDTADAGEVTPIYQYGERNFRADTLSFFARGQFQSQTGTDGVVDAARSNEAWIWYGHLRTFNSDAASMGRTNGYGSPGDALTPILAPGPVLTPGENRNNRYADDFRLGRVATLLVEPTDIKYETTNLTEQQRYERNSVLADGDVTKPIAFVRRDWWSPSQDPSGNLSLLPLLPSNDFVAAFSPAANTTYSPTPAEVYGEVYKFRPAATTPGNYRVGQNDRLEGTTAPAPTTPYMLAASSRTDVAGVGIKQMNRRVKYVSTATASWWNRLPNDWSDRFWVNPFPAMPMGPAGFSQRQQILSDATSQFIVEFAGDFITQNAATGAVTAVTPDGVLDFVVTQTTPPIVRQTRWYGLPRDVDGDGVISDNNAIAAWQNSPDVTPVRDARGGAISVFEKRLPPAPTSAGNYLTNVTEPTTAIGGNESGYVCVWGPNDFAPNAAGYRSVPQMLRIITDVRDPNGRLKEAVTQEMILPVRVSAAIEMPRVP